MFILDIAPPSDRADRLRCELLPPDNRRNEDIARNAEMAEASNAGMVDPNPFNVLASLLGMRGGFKFAEAIALLGAKISIFSALARDFILVAARRGDKGAALEGRAALSHANVLSDDNGVVDRDVEINYTDGDVEAALGTANQRLRRDIVRQNREQEVFVLNERIPNLPDESSREDLENRRTGLRNRSIGIV